MRKSSNTLRPKSLIITCSSFSCTRQHIFCVKLFFQRYIVVVDLFALMSLFYFCTPEICLTRVLYVLTLYWIKCTVHSCYVLFICSLLPVSCNMYVVFPSFPFNPTASSAAVDAIIVFFISSYLPVMSIIWLHLLVRIKSITFKQTLPLFIPMFPNQVSVEHS